MKKKVLRLSYEFKEFIEDVYEDKMLGNQFDDFVLLAQQFVECRKDGMSDEELIDLFENNQNFQRDFEAWTEEMGMVEVDREDVLFYMRIIKI